MKEYWYIERDLTTKYWNAQSSSDCCFFFFQKICLMGLMIFPLFVSGKAKQYFHQLFSIRQNMNFSVL